MHAKTRTKIISSGLEKTVRLRLFVLFFIELAN
jgi:hypothetical protein